MSRRAETIKTQEEIREYYSAYTLKEVYRDEWDAITQAIQDIQDIQDGRYVKVVRCGECLFFGQKQSFLCSMHNRAALSNDYCSYGVRREAAQAALRKEQEK